MTESARIWYDLGNKVMYRTFGYSKEPVAGIVLEHRNKRDTRCRLVINFDTIVHQGLAPNVRRYTLLRLIPLTIEEPITCPRCGLHGYITNGRWERS